MVSVQLSYEDSQGEPYGDLLSASYGGQPLDDRGRYLPGSGLSRSVPLALLVTAMHDAAVLYETDHSAAIALLEPAISRFAQDADGDAELQSEAVFWPKLLDLMKQGTPSGSLYGQ
jgi:Ca-activated chloride channel family protein